MTKKIGNILMTEQDEVFPQGEFTAWATDNGMRAAVLDSTNKVYKRFKGETAYQDAIRSAGDLNAISNKGK